MRKEQLCRINSLNFRSLITSDEITELASFAIQSVIHLVYPPKFWYKHCFQFLLGFTIAPREINTINAFFFVGGGGQVVLCER